MKKVNKLDFYLAISSATAAVSAVVCVVNHAD